MTTKRERAAERKRLLRLGSVSELGRKCREAQEREAAARTDYTDAERAMIDTAVAHPVSVDDLLFAGFSRSAAKRIIARADEQVQENGWTGGHRLWSDHDGTLLAVLPHKTVDAHDLAHGHLLRRCTVEQRSDVLDFTDRIGVYDGQRLTTAYPVINRRTLIRGDDMWADIYAERDRFLDEEAYAYDLMIGTFAYDMFVLGEPEVIDVPLGFRNRAGLSRVRHVLLDDVLAHGELRGVPTIRPETFS